MKHELSSVPLSLAKSDSSLHSTDKASLLHILEEGQVQNRPPKHDGKSCTIIDAMALVQAIGRPKEAKTFGDLSDTIVMNIFKNFEFSTRVYVIFDTYNPTSIKEATRQKRAAAAKSIRRIVEGPSVPLPVRWESFISSSENKQNFASFLSREIICPSKKLPPRYECFVAGGVADGMDAESSKLGKLSHMASNQEEADTRIVLHAADATSKGFQNIVIRSQDTDVLVLLVHHSSKSARNIWMKVGTSKKVRFISVRGIMQSIGPQACQALPGFHAITGCDTTSQFSGIGKKAAWRVFESCPTLLRMLGKESLTERVVADAESFVVRLYAPTKYQHLKVNELRTKLLHAKNPEKLPPTHDAPLFHIKRSHFQTLIWRKALVAKPKLPSILDYGWIYENGQVKPKLMSAEPVPSACIQLLTCGCQSGCTSSRCTCRRNNLSCIAACKCLDGHCHNPKNDLEQPDDSFSDNE